jgi:hypothetical protein
MHAGNSGAFLIRGSTGSWVRLSCMSSETTGLICAFVNEKSHTGLRYFHFVRSRREDIRTPRSPQFILNTGKRRPRF